MFLESLAKLSGPSHQPLLLQRSPQFTLVIAEALFDFLDEFIKFRVAFEWFNQRVRIQEQDDPVLVIILGGK